MKALIEFGISDNLGLKDKARIRAINFFGVFLILVSALYCLYFLINGEAELAISFTGLMVVSAIPMVLNATGLINASRIYYLFQSPITVILYSFLFGKEYDLQIFFVLFYGFAFIFLKPEEKRLIMLFFVYNTAFMVAQVFFNFVPFPALPFGEAMHIPLKITVYFTCILMGGIMFYYFFVSISGTEKKLIAAKNDAELANKTKQEFLANMSHEIRTPLNTVINTATLLKDKKNDDKEELTETLIQSSKHLFNLVNDILEFEKIEAGNIKINAVASNFEEFIKGIINSHRAKAKEKDLDLQVNLDKQIAPWLEIDEMRLTQILNNLISNGIKFTDRGGVLVSLSLEKDTSANQTILFEVIDTGIGINEKDQAFIFDSFTQAYMESDRKFGGAGLGLTIVKNLVQLHDSEIKLESRPSEGTKFSFSIEFNKAASPQKKIDTTDVLREDLKVLLVEDYEVNALLMKKVLSKWNIETDLAKNGFEAVSKSRDHKYDLILMDIHMPEMNGIEATSIIRADKEITNTESPIYALTADVTIYEDQSEYKDFDGVLVKPVEPTQLLNVLKTL